MQLALCEFPQEAEVLASQWRRYRKVVRGFWAVSARFSLSGSMQRGENIDMVDSDLLAKFVNGQQLGKKGLVLFTIHMGDYLHVTLNVLVMASHRQVIVLRRKSWSEEEYKTFDKANQIGHALLVVRQNEGAIVVMLYDLPCRTMESLAFVAQNVDSPSVKP